jgi:nitroreductase
MNDKPVANQTLLQQLHWRYAVKKFNPARVISPQDWETLEEALVLSPSSFGLQPWKFIVITDKAVRQQLVPVSWNQQQLTDCSHVVVLAIKKNLGARDVDEFLARTAQVRGVPVESLAPYREMIVGSLVSGPIGKQGDAWATRQAYIALGTLLTSAAVLGIDACPMEGFDPAKYDEILGLSKRGLAAVVVCALGYRSADDKYASLPKVRFEKSRVIERI